MHDLIDVIKGELRFIGRTPAVLLLIFMAPLAYPFLYCFLYVNKFETGVPVMVADLDGSTASRELIRVLDATETIRVMGIGRDRAIARQAIEDGAAEGSIVIAGGFERDLARNARPVVFAYLNSTRFMTVSDIGKGLGDAVAHMGRNILITTFTSKGISRENCVRYAEPLLLQTNVPANTLACYGDFMIPAILLLVLQQTLFAATAIAAAGTRRKSRNKPGGVNTGLRLIGKSIPYALLYSLYAAFFFTVHYRIWHIPFSGNVMPIALLTVIHFACVIAIGLLTGSFCRSRLSALFIGILSTYPVFLLSGIPWPVHCMPKAFQAVSAVLPSTYFLPAVFSAARLGAGWGALQRPIAMMPVIFAAVATVLVTRELFLRKRTAG